MTNDDKLLTETGDPDYEAMTRIVCEALIATAKGEPYDEAEADEALFVLAATQCLALGMTKEQVHTYLVENEAEVSAKLVKDPDTERYDLKVTIDGVDGE